MGFTDRCGLGQVKSRRAFYMTCGYDSKAKVHDWPFATRIYCLQRYSRQPLISQDDFPTLLLIATS